jgi:hypothetical protein
MALLLFIRSFPVRAVVFPQQEFPKGRFWAKQTSGSKKQLFEMNEE